MARHKSARAVEHTKICANDIDNQPDATIMFY
jgi:hypothetical protein